MSKQHIGHASVYLGRLRLGRYAMADKTCKAFDADDAPLGSFPDREAALAAIRSAAGSSTQRRQTERRRP